MTGGSAARASGVFRRQAVERLRTPEPLDRPVTFAPSLSRLGILGLGWLVIWLVIGLAAGW
jgi:hypothetical protein